MLERRLQSLQRIPQGMVVLVVLISLCSIASASSGNMIGRQSEYQLTEDLTCGISGQGNARDSYRCPSSTREQDILDRLLNLPGDEGLRRCCSEVGFCGSSATHCGRGCQAEFGFCNPIDPSDRPRVTQCGPKFKNAICIFNECCSSVGFCGNTTSHCKSPDCQLDFGRCDASLVPKGEDTAVIERGERAGEHVDVGVNIIHCVKPGTVALTYDDGPYNHTNDLLDLLEEFKMKATFFVTGNNLGKGPIDDPKYGWDTVIKRMHDDGHQIASHTWGHADLDSVNEEDRRAEMIKLEMALRNILGFIPTYMRPPYSRCSEDCMKTMKDLGYKVTHFDLDTEDAATLNPNDIKSGSAASLENSKEVFLKAVTETHPHPMEKKEGSRGHHLAIAHDLTYTSAVDLSRYMLEVMKENGWEGVTVGKCLGESGARGMWYRDEEGNPVPVPGYDDLAEENNTQGEKQGSGGSNDPAERPEGEVDDVDGGDKLVLDGSPGQRESLEDRPEDDGQADAEADRAGSGTSNALKIDQRSGVWMLAGIPIVGLLMA